MQKSGQINNIESTGGYTSQNGYIYTYMMTIQVGTEQITGEIGSKSEQYPLSAGAEITVDVRQTEHGTRFKKINPQQGGSRPQQAPSQQRQSNKGGGDKEVDWDAIARRKDISVLLSYAKDLVIADKIEIGSMPTYMQEWLKLIWAPKGQVQQVSANRTATAMGVTPEQQESYENAGEPPVDDDIPF